MDRYVCAQCEARPPRGDYMVHDTVWAKAGMPRRGFLCLKCLDERLIAAGHGSLSLTNFTDAPCNAALRFGYALAARVTGSTDELLQAYEKLLAENQALRDFISQRTTAAVGELREQGLKFNGNLPYGLEADAKTKKIKDSPEEKRLIDEIKQLHAAKLSLRAIARTLTERGFVNRDDNAIDAKQVARILDAEGIDRTRRQIT